jgi:hypothetical protein
MDGQLRPGDEGQVTARLYGLPDVVLQEDEALEFYEGDRRVATGRVVSIKPAKPDADAATHEDPVVFVMRDAFNGAVITRVFHEADGDWQFLTGADVSPDDAQLVHLSHVMALDPTLDEVADLPMGMWAHREGAGQVWHREVDDG